VPSAWGSSVLSRAIYKNFQGDLDSARFFDRLQKLLSGFQIILENGVLWGMGGIATGASQSVHHAHSVFRGDGDPIAAFKGVALPPMERKK